ncbi:MAG TPA: alpha/beta fold hydrolase [Acidobacteriaceae bacterium]
MGSKWQRVLLVIAAVLLSYLVVTTGASIWLGEQTVHLARNPVPATSAFESMIASIPHQLLADVSVKAHDGATLRGWFVEPSSWKGASVLLLHGVGDNRTGVTGYAAMFLNAGYAVLLPDSRAHGLSGGDLATYGVLEREDVHEWLRWLRERSGGCEYLFGESMGAAIALQAAAKRDTVCAVAVESSFASFREMAYDRVSQWTGLSLNTSRVIGRPVIDMALLYIRARYGVDLTKASPEEALNESSAPILIIADNADHNIPPRQASMLVRSVKPEDAVWVVAGADHCDAAAVAHQEFQRRVLHWFASHNSPPHLS